MKYHEVKFYIFVKRQVIVGIDKVVQIKVVRIFCEINYNLRIEKGESLQYTTTVLPAFLIPHSRVQVNLVLQAFSLYLDRNLETQHKAALHMLCSNRHSFRLYYTRIIARLDTWSTLFENRGEKKLVNLPLGEKWVKIETDLKNWPDPENLAHWRSYGHAVLVHKKMGLGP